MSSIFLHNTRVWTKLNIKIENIFIVIFDEIWPITLYYSTVSFVKFWSKLKNPLTSIYV